MDECGQPSGAALAVTCDGSDYLTGVRYEGKTTGLTLTVEPSASATITSAVPGSLPGASDYSGGVALEGGGTLKVALVGDVSVVNGASRTLVDFLLPSPGRRAGETVRVIGAVNANAYRTSGVYVLHEEGGAGEIGIQIGEGARIGTADAPVGLYGAHAHFKDGDGDIRITHQGEAYGHYAGILAERAVEGDIAINTAKGSVTSGGVWAKSVGGDVAIRHDGRVVIRPMPLYRLASGLDEDGYNHMGINVDHADATAGTNADPTGEITVVSSGDLDVGVADWERHVRRHPRAHGIDIETRGGVDSVVPVTVSVTGGVITTDGRSTSSGVRIHAEHRGGLIKVDFAGTLARTGAAGDGIHAYRDLNVPSRHATIKSSDFEVTFLAGARIGVDGDEPTVGGHGARLEHNTDHDGGSIKATAEAGAMIGTERTPVGGDGIWGRISYHGHAGDIAVTNRGFIHAKGSGVYAWHQGQGDVVVRHEAGKIIAGDEPGEFGRVNDDDLISELENRAAGILAAHTGSQVIQNDFPADLSTKSVETGKIEIASGADIDSKGDGVLAYAEKVDATRAVTPVVPITVSVTGGTITAKGYGIHAETATDYVTSVHQTTDATQAGKIEVTVGAGATVMAEKDGVRVAGKRVFASGHARAGQRDQTVAIHGKVMGGGSGSAGAPADGSGASVRTSGAAEMEPAGVHMVGGGTLEIGPRAEIGAGSGVAVRANGALTIAMEKDERGRIGDVRGKILNSETTFEGVAVGDAVTSLGQVENRGVYDGGTLRQVMLKAIEGGHEFVGESAGEYRKYHARARVYEALPSVLLDLSAPTSPHARMAAARDADGGWARVSFGDGEREADRSTTEGGEMGRALSWDLERWSAEMGFDIPTSTEGLLLGVSAHYRDGRADVERGGRIEVSGFGVGASATYAGEDGWYWDGQVSYTRLDDIDLSSRERGKLVSGLEGDGYAVGVEVGRRMEMEGRELALTPRGGLVWSSVDADGFQDVKVEGYAGDRGVGFGSEDSFKGRVGALLESADGRFHASLDVEHEFSEERSIMASGARLESEGESTWARLGAGFRAELDETGEAVLSGEGFYALADGDNHDYGASVALRARF